MNPFNRDGSAKADVRQVPVNLPGDAGQAPLSVKVDASICVDGVLLVAGWRSGGVELGISERGVPVECHLIPVDRPDVANHLGVERSEGLGFVLVAHVDMPSVVALECTSPGTPGTRSWPLRVDHVDALCEDALQVFRPAVAELVNIVEPFSSVWAGLVTSLPGGAGSSAAAKGHIDFAVACSGTGNCVVSGWVVCDPQAPVWIETAAGIVSDVRKARRSVRTDVQAALGIDVAGSSVETGFTALVPGGRAGDSVELKTIQGGMGYVLARSQCDVLPSDPASASRRLFGVGAPVEDFADHTESIDRPIIDGLLQRRAESWGRLEVIAMEVGKLAPAPDVSIVIPLYGRLDFLEHQLIEFSRDPWLLAKAEIVYVIDDPALVAPMRRQAKLLHQLYGVPWRWVWGGANRGFSGANNLGAEHSRGAQLVFLNSDAFPVEPGWVRELTRVLEERPDIGAVGPRLLFADGSIQHAGMAFRRRDDLGVWVNHHPHMGLAPSLDPATSLTVVPAVTGACMALRRVDFDRVGGWDTGYLIGDFEDSDLCFKLRAEGFSVAYLPSVELTHLERQSFRMLGSGEYRTKVVIYNAVRHQQRWGHLIEASASADARFPHE